ncbi:MAG: hypothetical protein AB7H97_04720 [Pseudobdellovibrionaceae bacterium]
MSVMDIKTNKKKELGSTPVSIRSSEIAFSDSMGPYVLVVSKNGFLDENIFIPRFSGEEMDFNFALKPSLNMAQVNPIINDLFRAKNKASRGEFDAAIEILNALIGKHTDLASLYEMRGSIYLLKKESELAFNDFEQAHSLDPGNLEVNRVYNLLVENKRSSPRTPSSVKEEGR